MRSARLPFLLAVIGAAAQIGLAGAPAEALQIVQWRSHACVRTSTTNDLDTDCFAFLPNPDTVTTLDLQPAFKAIQSGDATANAFQSPLGYDRAVAGAHSTLDLAAAASAQFTLTVINNGPLPEPLTFRFLILNAALELEINDYVALGDDVPVAEIFSTAATRRTGFPPTTYWRYQALLASTSSDFLVGLQDSLNFIDPQAIGKLAIDSITQGRGTASVDFAPFVGTLDLGILDPGEGTTLVYTIGARVYTGVHDPLPRPSPNPPAVALSALIEDPFSLESGFFLNGRSLASLLEAADDTPSNTVPVPAALLLLGAGLLAIAATRRGRR
jgi:hypothetical protein